MSSYDKTREPVGTDPEAFRADETPEQVTEKAPPSVRRLSRLPAARG